LKQVNPYRVVNQAVPCPISCALNSARGLPHISNDAVAVRLLRPGYLHRRSIRSINGESHSRFAKLVQNARLASWLDGCALLPTHKFTTTTENVRLQIVTAKLAQVAEQVSATAVGINKLSRRSYLQHG